MSHETKRKVVERYINAYNAFDIDNMLAVLHSHIEFRNISGGEETASANGIGEFRSLAEKSTKLFKSRKQTVTGMVLDGDVLSVNLNYEGVLAGDLPNGMKAGEKLTLSGKSEFTIKDGKVVSLTDYS